MLSALEIPHISHPQLSIEPTKVSNNPNIKSIVISLSFVIANREWRAFRALPESVLVVFTNEHSLDNSILFNPITLEGRRGTTDKFATIPFHLVLFSAVLAELAKSIPVYSLILSFHLFFCLPLFLFPFTVPCRIVFARPEDLETWPNHLSFRFLTRVSSSSYSPMAVWIFLRTFSLVTWSLYEMFNSLR